MAWQDRRISHKIGNFPGLISPGSFLYARANIFCLPLTHHIAMPFNVVMSAEIPFGYPSFTDVIVSDPPTALSLKNETLSLFVFNPNVYIRGK